MFSQLNLLKMSCFFSPLLPPCQLFWDLLQASNLKWAHLVDKSAKFLLLNICYVLYVLLWIKYWLMWFESLLVFIWFKFKKTSQHFQNSGCKLVLVSGCYWKQVWLLINISCYFTFKKIRLRHFSAKDPQIWCEIQINLHFEIIDSIKLIQWLCKYYSIKLP